MNMTSEAAAYFEQVAHQWDAVRAGYFTEALRDAALARVALTPQTVVADVGAGTGFMSAGLAPRVGQVHAIDGSEAMLAVARENLSAFQNVVYHQADGGSLPLPDQSVDAVFANMYLHHCTDPLGAIREMVRILRPGGRLVITDMDAHPYTWFREEMTDVWLGFARDQVRSWLREAGLVNALVTCSGNSCCATSEAACTPEEQQTAKVSVFLAAGSRRVEGAQQAVQAQYGARAQSGSCGCTPAPAASTSCCTPASASSSCCGAPEDKGTPVSYDTGYDPDVLATLPPEAAELSLGCGNPVALAALQPGETVLDVGCGSGVDVFYAAQQVGEAGRAIGLDMTPEMIQRAERLARRSTIKNVEFRLGHAEAMPVEDGSVDVLLSNCVFNLCEDKGRAFEEVYRVMKPGGRIVISDMVTDTPLPRALHGDPEQWAGCVRSALPEQEYLDLLAQAGLQEITPHRGQSGGTIQGVKVYSLLVEARKLPRSSGCCG